MVMQWHFSKTCPGMQRPPFSHLFWKDDKGITQGWGTGMISVFKRLLLSLPQTSCLDQKSGMKHLTWNHSLITNYFDFCPVQCSNLHICVTQRGTQKLANEHRTSWWKIAKRISDFQKMSACLKEKYLPYWDPKWHHRSKLMWRCLQRSEHGEHQQGKSGVWRSAESLLGWEVFRNIFQLKWSALIYRLKQQLWGGI